jgi:hypothetical protein
MAAGRCRDCRQIVDAQIESAALERRDGVFVQFVHGWLCL